MSRSKETAQPRIREMAVETSRPSPKISILRLPTELRLAIYDILFGGDPKIDNAFACYNSLRVLPQAFSPPTTQVCRKIRCETLERFYGKLCWELRVCDPANFPKYLKRLEVINPIAINSIRRIHMDVFQHYCLRHKLNANHTFEEIFIDSVRGENKVAVTGKRECCDSKTRFDDQRETFIKEFVKTVRDGEMGRKEALTKMLEQLGELTRTKVIKSESSGGGA